MAKAKKKAAKKAVKKTAVKAKKTPMKKAAPKKAAKKSTPKKSVSKKAAPAKMKRSLGKATLPKATAAPTRKSVMNLNDFVTPLDDRIIVRLTEADRKTAGGLFIPDTVADVSGNLEGLVVAVGRGHRDPKGRVRPMDVKAGDRILFSEYSGSKIRLKDEDFVILREGDVAGVLS